MTKVVLSGMKKAALSEHEVTGWRRIFCDRVDGYYSSLLFVALGCDDFAATVHAGRRNMVTTMDFAGLAVNRDCQLLGVEGVVRAMHATLRRRLLVLLDCHDYS
jgi:hypothetical protein